MSTFTLHLQSGGQYERIDDVTSFRGTDASGSFGILAGHERMMTVLEFALARFGTANGSWQYVALPGGVLYFVENELFISTHRFILGDDYNTIAAAVSGTLAQQEEQMQDLKRSITRIEREMTRRLWELQRDNI
jgi:F-type H+-transporting ATPase subunit epsilon